MKYKETLPGYWSETRKRCSSSVSIFLWEIRSAVRALARERVFTAFALILIMLGAGLLTTMFALVDAVSLRKLDVPDPDSLFGIVALREGGRAGIPVALFDHVRESLEGADSLCGMGNTYIPVTHEGRTEILFTEYMTGDYYRTMGVQPLLGRLLTPTDDGPVAVISDSYWRRMGKDPAIIGRVIRAGSVSLTIVGVVPAKAHQLWRFMTTDLVVPFRIGMLVEGTPPEKVSRETVYVTARLMKGVTFQQVQHRLDALWPRLLAETIPPGQSLDEWTRARGAQVGLMPASRGYLGMSDALARATLALFVFAGLVSLTLCSNLAGLLLSRGLGRQKEYAVRMALGATRGNLVRQALFEALVLSVFGGAGAVLLSGWLTEVCSRILPLPWGAPVADYGVRVDGRVVAFALAAALATAVLAQILPALRSSSVDVGDSLRLAPEDDLRTARGSQSAPGGTGRGGDRAGKWIASLRPNPPAAGPRGRRVSDGGGPYRDARGQSPAVRGRARVLPRAAEKDPRDSRGFGCRTRRPHSDGERSLQGVSDHGTA